jgi:peptide/nickel transport system permease protein
MTRFVLKRAAGAVVQILIVTVGAWLLFFVIARFTGASPAQRIAGKTATQAQIRLVTKLLGLSKPYWQQYLIFLGHLATGNFGYSYVQARPVAQIIWPALRVTASLVFGAALLWMLIAVPIGAYCAKRPRSLGDVTFRVLAVIGMSIPVFWLAPMVAYVFGFEPTEGRLLGIPLPHRMSIFPISGYVDLGTNPVQWAYHLVLPWLTMAVGFAAVYIRYLRTMTAEQLSEDYTRTATAKGASSFRVLTRHVGRNLLPPVTVLLGADVAYALTGVFFVETVFNLPGIGFTGVSAIENLDYPVITAVIIVSAFAAVLSNAIVDILHIALDPRLRKVTAR